jgi:mannose-6-phosphate isomerase-like protein (cupin superfamily)
MKPAVKITLSNIILSCALLVAGYDVAAQSRSVVKPVPGMIETCIDRDDPGKVQTTGNGWQHYYVPPGMADTLSVKVSCVFKGVATHNPHKHNPDETFFILRGPVRVHVNGEERVLRTGDFYYTPALSTHNIQRTAETDTIKYLMFMRETTHALAKPFRTTKPGYTIDDCVTFRAQDPRWAGTGNARVELLDREFGDGMRVIMDRLASGRKTLRNEKGAAQTAVYILSGRAGVTLDGNRTEIAADNTLYCPKGSRYTIRRIGDQPLVLLTVTTP